MRHASSSSSSSLSRAIPSSALYTTLVTLACFCVFGINIVGVSGSHFQFGSITWVRSSPPNITNPLLYEYTFSMISGWRQCYQPFKDANAGRCPTIGNIVSIGSLFFFQGTNQLANFGDERFSPYDRYGSEISDWINYGQIPAPQTPAPTSQADRATRIPNTAFRVSAVVQQLQVSADDPDSNWFIGTSTLKIKLGQINSNLPPGNGNTLTLPFTLMFMHCCRISTLLDGNGDRLAFVGTVVNQGISSPVTTSRIREYAYVNVPIVYSVPGIELSQHPLHYSFTPTTSPGLQSQLIAPFPSRQISDYSKGQPNIDPITGKLTWIPTRVGRVAMQFSITDTVTNSVIVLDIVFQVTDAVNAPEFISPHPSYDFSIAPSAGQFAGYHFPIGISRTINIRAQDSIRNRQRGINEMSTLTTADGMNFTFIPNTNQPNGIGIGQLTYTANINSSDINVCFSCHNFLGLPSVNQFCITLIPTQAPTEPPTEAPTTVAPIATTEPPTEAPTQPPTTEAPTTEPPTEPPTTEAPTTTAPTTSAPAISFDAHPRAALHGSYIVPSSSRSLCPDLISVVPQCSVSSLEQAKTICSNDPACGGITCNTGRNDCQLRYYPLTTLDTTWTTFNSYIKRTPTQTPTTEAPTTVAPTTLPPTEPPTTEPPTTEPTEPPTTEAPTTEAPTTEAPTTEAPTTVAPTTLPPTDEPTDAPTQAPTENPTDAPITPTPTTTAAPTTVAPTCTCTTTAAPTTEAPTTAAPTFPTFPLPPVTCPRPLFGGVVDSYNLWLIDSWTSSNSDVDGVVAIGGAVILNGYSIGRAQMTAAAGAVESQVSMIVAGSLNWAHGTLYGRGLVYGASTVNSVSGEISGSTQLPAPGATFISSHTHHLTTLAASIQANSYNGTTLPACTWEEKYTQITITGVESQVCRVLIPTSTLASATHVIISAPHTATVIVVVNGSSMTFANKGIQLSGGITPRSILWVAASATSITMNGVGFQGSILAPSAHVSFNNGVLHGQLIAKSFMGSANIVNQLFCASTSTSPSHASKLLRLKASLY